MKTLILFVASALVLLISSCNQNSPSPAPAPAAPAPAPTPTPTTSFTSADSAISGKWILDAVETYTMPANTLFLTTPYNNPNSCYLNLMLIPHTVNMDYKQCFEGFLNCAPSTSIWRLVGGDLDVGGALFIIESQTATNLVLRGPGNNLYQKFLFHK